jgi:hypothetical protein
MDADTVIVELAALTIVDLQRVHAAAGALLDHYAETAQPDYGRPAEARETYRQEYTRCGRPHCKHCVKGPGHGPYWYAYRRENGKLRKRYVGKERPA